MAVWVKITGASGTYYLSGQTAAKSGIPYEGRLMNAPAIEKLTKATDTGNPVRELTFSINNLKDTGAFWIPMDTETFWNKEVEISVDGVTEKWVGKIRSLDQQGNGTLNVSIVDDTYALFKKPIPDETVRIADFSQVGTSGTNTTINIPLGGTTSSPIKVKGTLVDRVNFIYLVAVGEIQSIVAVQKDRATADPGTYTTATGTAGQPTYPGYAYVQFNADPRDSAGRWPDVTATVTGMKLGASTEAECRNPARILYYLLTTANSGACGWGLGVPSGDIDATSFNAAIAACDSLGFKIDGVINERRAASVWIDQICRAMRGKFIKKNGKHTLTVDADTSSVKTYTGLNMVIDSFGRGIYSDRKNRVVVDYRFDVADGRLLGSAVRDDATSQADIGVNEYRTELLLVSDHASANKIADYLSNIEVYGEKRIQFSTKDMPAGGLNQDDVITIDRSDYGLSSVKFRVTSCVLQWFNETEAKALVTARSYDSAVFGNTTPPAEPTWPIPAGVLPGPESMQAPAAVSAVSLSSDVTVQDADGSTQAYVYGTFNLGARTLFVTVEIGLGISPVPSTWRTVAATSTGSFRVEGLTVGAPYTFRFTAHNSGGDSTPVLATITASRDTSAPNAPSAVSAGVFFKTTRIEITRSVAVSNNLAGYAVYRHTSNDSASASEIGVIATSPNEQKVAFLDGNTSYATTYYYWAKAISRAGIRSGFFPGVNDGAQAVTSKLTGSADIAARTITADLICAASITAAEITTDYLTALKFRTSANTGDGGASGNGICFDTTSIKGFAAGSATPNFTLDATTGGITANLGSVGGWTIATYGLYKNTGVASTSAGMAPGDYPFYAGCEYAGRATAPFSVTKAGAIKATSGTVGGFSLGANLFSSSYTSGSCCAGLALNPGVSGSPFLTSLCMFWCYGAGGSQYTLITCNGLEQNFSAMNYLSCLSAHALWLCYNYGSGTNRSCMTTGSFVVGKMNPGGCWTCLSYVAWNGISSSDAVCAGTCVTAGTTLYATQGIGAGGMGRFGGWYEAGSPTSGPAAEIGYINNIAWVMGYDRANSRYYKVGLQGGTPGGTTYNYICIDSDAVCVAGNTGYLYATYICAGNASSTIFGGPQFAINTNGGSSIDIYSCMSGSWAIHQKLCNGNTTFFLPTCVCTSLGTWPLHVAAGGYCVSIGPLNSTWSHFCTNTSSGFYFYCHACFNGNLGAGCTIYTASCNGTISLNGTLPGYSAMQYPTLCSSGNYLYLQAGSQCSKYAYLDCNGSFRVPSAIGAGNSNLNARFHLKAASGGWDGAIKMERAGANTQTWSIAVGDDNVLYFGYASCPTTCPTYYACLTTVGVWTNYSQRAGKTDFTQVSVLPTLRGLPLSAYRLRDTDIWGFGPTAEDWQCAYPWLGDGRGIAPSAMAGIALGGIQELDSCFASQQACILSLESRLAAIEEKLSAA